MRLGDGRRVGVPALYYPRFIQQSNFVDHSFPLNFKTRVYKNKLLISNLVKKIDSCLDMT